MYGLRGATSACHLWSIGWLGPIGVEAMSRDESIGYPQALMDGDGVLNTCVIRELRCG